MSFGIKLEAVAVEFDGHIALSGINLELTTKSVAVIGANGSGKSTFARLLNGLVKPTSGKVNVLGKSPSVSEVGFVFSNPDLQIVMPTVLEDVAFSLTGKKLSKVEVRSRVEAALGAVGILELQESNCHTLSSGQKQLLAIASAMVREPKVLVADEPTTLLDLPNTKLITKILHELPVQQLVLVTHDLDLAATCDEVVWFDRGVIRKSGNPKSIVAEYRKSFD
ncbi:MAG: energy-coupling factor ABC transporter ATP-binding protein [Rhodoluna sp.]|nr:energy-coupling factor ABC transporter ATP-binding protein [Rhodoluna sp.]